METQIGIVLNTYNRADLVPRAIASVLDQTMQAGEFVVVDDGSTDSTPNVLAALEGSTMKVLRQQNSGLCRSRNAGARSLLTDWLVFLDDDDVLMPNAVRIFASHIAPNIGLIAAGVTRVSEEGTVLANETPCPLYDFFDGNAISVMPGSFCLRRSVFEAAGGYLADLAYGHQTEMLLRCWIEMQAQGLHIASDPQPTIRYTVRSAADRPMQNPCLTATGAARIISHQPQLSRTSPVGYASVARVGAVAAARIGDRRLASTLFTESIRAHLLGPLTLVRAGAVFFPALRRRLWPDFRSPEQQSQPCRVEPSEQFFLPFRYAHRAQASRDLPSAPYWNKESPGDPLNQWPVYRIARRRARRLGGAVLLDVGCGTGEKLTAIDSSRGPQLVGLDQASGTGEAKKQPTRVEWIDGDISDPKLWEKLVYLRPRLILCADVIEHLDDPYELLRGIRTLCDHDTEILISTPDRRRLELTTAFGPPANPRHTREWTTLEFELLLRSAGFRVNKTFRRLPRGYAPTPRTAKRLVWRLFHGRAVPDRRSSVTYLATVAT